MTDKAELELDDDFIEGSDEVVEQVEVAKTNLTKRRIIDNLLEERRLQKHLTDYDFDL
ncbi:MAG TPA: hypothetical protein VK019_09020 [Pseudomonas sp.]|nr:hypothetical protein [Pseudomonas sp.]